jgi:hypothetical protein
MKIKLNGKDGIPVNWDGVTFGQFLKLKDCKDHADVVSVFLNMKPDTIRNAQIKNLVEVLQALRFMDRQMPMIIPKSINGFLIPKDLNFNTIGQFEDLKDLSKKVGEKGENVSVYADMVTVYAMPDYNSSKPEQREEFTKQFFNAPCTEVMAVGNFTLVKLIELSLPGSKTFRKVNILTRKFRLVLKSWRARLAFFIRFATWKRSLRTKGMSF